MLLFESIKIIRCLQLDNDEWLYCREKKMQIFTVKNMFEQNKEEKSEIKRKVTILHFVEYSHKTHNESIFTFYCIFTGDMASTTNHTNRPLKFSVFLIVLHLVFLFSCFFLNFKAKYDQAGGSKCIAVMKFT